nr:CPBP family intramembrane glutamic endopeptidase [uncultured Flavobacterium sp.]
MRKKLISLLLLFSTFSLIYNPFTKFPFTFLVIIIVILIVTFVQEKTLQGLNFKAIKSKDLIAILISYVLLELSMDFLFQPLVNRIFNEPADYTSFKIIEGNTFQYQKWLLNMWISAAIGEELFFRSFAFLQLRKIFNNNNILVVISSSILFCLPHLYQGYAGLAMTFMFGLAFGFIYLKYKNIWVNIIVHGLIDSVFLTLSYLGLTDFYLL